MSRLLFPVIALWISTHCACFGATDGDSKGHAAPFAIEVVDRENGWPVPLVELRTTHSVRFVTDNAGTIAFDLPELMGKPTWFSVSSDGYVVPADGFGYRGVQLTPAPGARSTIRVERTSIAKRLGRITGAGLFAEQQQIQGVVATNKHGVLGCDSVQNTVHNGKLFWLWGDTTVAKYPLGIFHMTGATSALQPLERFMPPVQLELDYFTDQAGSARAVAEMPGSGPTWLTGVVSLPDERGTQRLVAMYNKIKPPLEAYESGLCVWNEDAERFEHFRTVWRKSDESPSAPPMPRGHVVIVEEENGRKWAYFGDPLPTLRCSATFEAWADEAAWEPLDVQQEIQPAADGASITPHSGSIAWNAYRQRWVTVFMQALGAPSAFGELWYAEADSPEGPWGPAVKILSHRNYTFYNPRLHPALTPAESPILLFEGTYTHTFSSNPEATPRYDYNQLLYRLDLDDPKLAPAQNEPR